MSTSNESNIIRLPAPWEHLNRQGVPLGRASGQKRFEPGPRAKAPTSGGPLKRRRLAALVAAASRVAQAYECRALLKAIQDHAILREWSGRETAKRTGLNRATLARLSRAEGKLPYWLPRLRNVVARLNTQPATACTSSPEVLAP